MKMRNAVAVAGTAILCVALFFGWYWWSNTRRIEQYIELGVRHDAGLTLADGVYSTPHELAETPYSRGYLERVAIREDTARARVATRLIYAAWGTTAPESYERILAARGDEVRFYALAALVHCGDENALRKLFGGLEADTHEMRLEVAKLVWSVKSSADPEQMRQFITPHLGGSDNEVSKWLKDTMNAISHGGKKDRE
jgi:hypothetical protein